MQQGNIVKGDVIKVTASPDASGAFNWKTAGKEPVFVRLIEPNDTFYCGPYMAEANFEIALASGTVAIENVTTGATAAPIPLAYYTTMHSDVQAMLVVTQAEYDAIAVKNDRTLYLVTE